MTAVSVAQTRLMTDDIHDATRGLRDLASRSSNNAAWVVSSDLVIVQVARIINGRRNNVLRPVVSPPHVHLHYCTVPLAVRKHLSSARQPESRLPLEADLS